MDVVAFLVLPLVLPMLGKTVACGDGQFGQTGFCLRVCFRVHPVATLLVKTLCFPMRK